jgi:hypothetical protein
MKYQIIIEIDDEDNVIMETRGIKGNVCVEEIKDITKNFGKIVSSKNTKEYYEKDESKLKSKKTNKLFSK